MVATKGDMDINWARSISFQFHHHIAFFLSIQLKCNLPELPMPFRVPSSFGQMQKINYFAIGNQMQSIVIVSLLLSFSFPRTTFHDNIIISNLNVLRNCLCHCFIYCAMTFKTPPTTIIAIIYDGHEQIAEE